MIKNLFLTIIFLLMFSFVSVLVPLSGYACSCVATSTVQAELERSKAVFSGKVLTVKQKQHLDGHLTKDVLFDVKRTWKGLSESQVMITTGLGGGDCGYEFEEGMEYLVYANPSSMYGGEDGLATTICDRTNELSAAQEDLHQLDAGEAPTAEVNLEVESLLGRGLRLALAFIAVAIIGIVAFFVSKKLRQ